MPEPEFILSPGTDQERRFRLPYGEYVVGSGDECQIVLPIEGIAARHARLKFEPKSCTVTDLDSVTGTFVARNRLEDLPAVSRYPVDLRFGESEARVELASTGDTVIATTVAADPNATQVDLAPAFFNPVAPRRDRIARYRLGDEIAKGGMGSIMEAEDGPLKRTVAMKLLLPHVEGDEDSRRRFLREATVLGRLEHPNIVPIHELGRDENGRPFYTMKRVKGRTLAAILSAIQKGDETTIGHYTLDRLLNVFAKVCDAIAFTHFNGIVHRDLKPDNIMVGEFGEVLVMDWGVAKVLNDDDQSAEEELRAQADANPPATPDSEIVVGTLTMDGAVVGTPHYMSPEQARGRLAEVDAQSDIFALGGILYTILTLRTPVSGRSIEEILKAIVKGDIRPPESFNAGGGGKKNTPSKNIFPHCPNGRIPTAVSAITMRALAVDKANRYQNVVQLAADIDAYRRGYATSAEELGTFGQLRLLVKRHRRELIAAILIWGGLTVALQGGRAIGSLATSIGFAGSFITIGLALWFVFRLSKAERVARALAVEAREEMRKAKAQEEEASRMANRAESELEQAHVRLAHANVTAAAALCREGDGRGALRLLGQIADDHRTPEWEEVFKDARAVSLKQD